MTLRVFGDDLDPDQITGLLRCEPSGKARKGDVTAGRATGRRREAPCGSWLLESDEDGNVDLEEQLNSLLSRVSGDSEVWGELTRKYKVDLFCGLFLDGFNRGFSLSAEVLRKLSARNLEIVFDVYAPDSPGETEG